MQLDTSSRVYFITNACEEGRLTHKDSGYLQKKPDSIAQTSFHKLITYFYPCGHLTHNDTEAAKIIQRINKDKKPSAQLLIWGCLPKINPEVITELYQGPLIGPEEWTYFTDLFNIPKDQINDIFANIPYCRAKNIPLKDKLNTLLFEKRYCYSGRTWYIKIISGCKYNCTYCSDRLAYKWAKSIPINKIIRQFELGLKANYQHFYFVGRDLGSYGYDLGLTLADLLNKIAETFPNQNFKISLFNVSPDSLIQLYPKMDTKILSGRIFQIGSHIQSGSERILQLMGKTFSLNDWKKIIKEIAKKNPKIRLATSIMVGFPTETDEDFKKTIELLNALRFERIDAYAYNERPNLASSRLDGQILELTKLERLREVQNIARKKLLERRARKLRIIY